jgi:fructokinase
MKRLVGGIEAGGTKFVCAVGTGPDDIRAEVRFPTESPKETIHRSIEFFREQVDKLGPLAAVGIAAFGPVDPDPDSSTYGYITKTPKLDWVDTDIAGPVGDTLGVPVGFDTDVNGAALGEGQWGAARGLDTFLYLTIGTGIGGGAVVNGSLLHGLVHPEMGHVRIPHDRADDPFEGSCPYHEDCLEGLATGPSIAKRWEQDPASLPEDHKAWELEARYLSYALANYICVLSPQRIIMGGGVMDQRHLFPRIRRTVPTLLNEYIQADALLQGIDQYIVPPGLGNRSGVLGALALGYLAAGAL